MKKYILVIIVVIILSGGVWAYQNNQPKVIKMDLPVAQEFDYFAGKNFEVAPVDNGLPENLEVTDTLKSAEELVEPIPIVQEVSSVNLAVPFTSQAPTANWDEPFQDACEEASLLMVDYYYQNKKMSSSSEVEDILISMVDKQKDFTDGIHRNITAQETSELANRLFGYRTELVTPLTADKIREILKTGRPVIVPADGHILDNPYFRGDGPDYHMLVIKGFVDDKFITNDPGTKRGADFVYTEANLMSAIFDWDTKKTLATGPKVGLVLYQD